MSSTADLTPADDEFRERLAELARSDENTAIIYEAYYEEVYGEEVPSS